MTMRMLCVGDSLTEGLYQYWEMSPYTDTLAQCLGPDWDVENAGVSGETTQQIHHRLVEHKILSPSSGQYDVVIILGGTNDLCELSSNEIAQNLASLYQLAIAHNPQCCTFMLSIPQMRFKSDLFEEEKRLAINQSLQEMCDRHPNAFYIDWAQEFPNPPGSQDSQEPSAILWSDNIHLSRYGYEKMGKLIYSRIKEHIPTNAALSPNSSTCFSL